PELNITGLEPQYCNHDPETVITTFPSGGTISGENIIVAPSGLIYFTPQIVGEQTITYHYSDSLGCNNSISKTITVHPLPNIQLGPKDTLLLSGSSILLGPDSVDPDIAYVWSTGDATPFIEVSNPGYYILQGTNSTTGCLAADTIRVELLNTIGNHDSAPQFLVFPNPFRHEINLISIIDIETLTVFDLSGKLQKVKWQKKGPDIFINFGDTP